MKIEEEIIKLKDRIKKLESATDLPIPRTVTTQKGKWTIKQEYKASYELNDDWKNAQIYYEKSSDLFYCVLKSGSGHEEYFYENYEELYNEVWGMMKKMRAKIGNIKNHN